MRKPFQTLEQVREYVSGDTIECLVCGREFRRLHAKHLEMHSMTADDYRLQFGIPWNQSLTSQPSRQASREAMTPDRIEAFKRASSTRNPIRRPPRQRAEAVRNQWRREAKKGRYLARTKVTAACAHCGALVVTTALCATQPIHCEQCASPGSLKVRRYYQRQKARSVSPDLST
jgi:DNA-directed RNA polymerase subunit RPC12/RpoP